MKEINAEIYLNGNNDGTTVKLSDEEAENLLTLWKEAQDTILKGMEEEDYWEKFDPWLKEKAPNLHEKIMDAYYQETSERLSIGGWVESDEFMSIGHDIDGAYLDYDNEVVINQIFLHQNKRSKRNEHENISESKERQCLLRCQPLEQVHQRANSGNCRRSK